MISNEVWKPVKDFEGLYEISNLGRVKTFVRCPGKVLKPSNQKSGYLQVTLSKNKKAHFKWVHRLVAEVFLEPSTSKHFVNHKDGNKKNNIPDNLEYCTPAENNAHAGKLNLKPIGSNHTNSKLTHTQLKEVRSLLQQGILTHKQISKIFNTHRTTISKIARNESYKKEVT
jgi:hypothetical protein